MEKLNSLNIGLIGCGKAAEIIYLPAIKKFTDINLTAVVDPTEERRNFLCKNFNYCFSYSSINPDFIERIDAAIICSPPNTHIALSSELLKQNKFVLVEKPLALSTEGIKELIDIESSSKASLMMAFNHRYWQPVIDLKERLTKNSQSDLTDIVFTSDYSKWNPVSFISDPLDDLGSHVFDIIRFILDKEITSVSAKTNDSKIFEINVNVLGNKIVNCCLAHSGITIRSLKAKSEKENFFITLKSARISPPSGKMRSIIDFNDRLKRKLLKKDLPIIKSYETQLKNFFDFVHFNKNNVAGIKDGVSAILAVQAARISCNNNGKEVLINELK